MRNSDRLVIGAALSILISIGYYQSRPNSRKTLNPEGKNLEYKLPVDFKRMINVGSGRPQGDVMITYETTNGNIVTKEYNRGGLFETAIKWTEQSEKR